MTDEPSGLKTYAIVELMGHQQIAGLVSEELVAGKPMLRVDVPDPDGGDFVFHRYYSPGALYALTPCTEDEVRRVVDYYRPSRLPVYVPPTSGLLAEGHPDVEEWDEAAAAAAADDDGMPTF